MFKPSVEPLLDLKSASSNNIYYQIEKPLTFMTYISPHITSSTGHLQLKHSSVLKLWWQRASDSEKNYGTEEFLDIFILRARSGLFLEKSWEAWNSCTEKNDSSIFKPVSGVNLKMAHVSDV